MIIKIMELKTTTASLRAELEKIKADKAAALQAINKANIKAQGDDLASKKEIKSLKEASTKEIDEHKSTTRTLRVVLERFKTDKTKTDEARNLANAKVATEKLASAKEINALKLKTTSLRKELDKITTERAESIKTLNSTSAEAQADKLASAKEINALKLKTTSLRKELDKVTTERAESIKALNSTSAEAQADKLASANEINKLKEKKEKEIKGLKDKSAKEIANLKAITTSLRKRLDKFKSDKAKSMLAKIIPDSQTQSKKLISPKIIAKSKTKTASVSKEVGKIDSSGKNDEFISPSNEKC